MPEGRNWGVLIEPGMEYHDEFGQLRYRDPVEHKVRVNMFEDEGGESISSVARLDTLPIRFSVRKYKDIAKCNVDWCFRDEDDREFGIMSVRNRNSRKRELLIFAEGSSRIRE